MFSGRNSEIRYLNTYYEREGSQILVLYGQRNVGKTSLLFEFTKDKPGYYYRARSASEREQRYQWGKELQEEAEGEIFYPTFTEIFELLPGGEGKKRVIVIDEFQHIVKAGNEFMRELRGFVKDEASGRNMVILCSSSIGWVENGMIPRLGAAAYELSGFYKIRELGFGTLMDFFPGFSMKQCIEAYAVLGGVPEFWKHFNDKLDIKENICRYILNKDAFLHEEGLRIVEEELRETGVYNTILAAIASGKHKLNDLYHHTEFSRAKISVYLKNLMELELVEKVFSYDTEGKANTQKGIYRISNHLVHFYFTYLYPNLSELKRLGAEEFYNRYIEPDFVRYVSDYFKLICKEYIEKWNKKGELPIKADRIGEWVGKMGTIDFVARSEETGETILGVCNWEKPLMEYEEYEKLLSCAEKAKLGTEYIYLFSRWRFDAKLKQEAGCNPRLQLFGMDAK
ncbi:MAG: ATP-binding protein [Clostridium sp.]|nr:ATP-binding protein [Clostridium sp.]